MFGEWVVEGVVLEREGLVEGGDFVDDGEDDDEKTTCRWSAGAEGRRSRAGQGVGLHDDEIVANISVPISLCCSSARVLLRTRR